MGVLEMSVAASVLIVAIVIVRAVSLYRLPKKMFLCLWGIAAIRLLFPFSIPLPFSVPADWAAPVSDLAANPGAYIPLDTIAAPDGPEATIPIALMIWLAGICACALYFAISYFKCRREFKTSLPVESEFIDRWLKEHPLLRSVRVRQTDRTKTPLTYGIFHPVILLPKRIDLTDEASLRYVLAHEYIHIRHLDVLTKLVLTVAVCVHWFNPLVWVMYILANRDIELICDETVIKSYEPQGRSTYALTLIKLEEVKGRVAFVNYFSKNFVEERITAIMKTKKYTLSVMIIALMLVFGAATVFAAPASAAHGGSHLGATTTLDLCNVSECNTAGVHQHGGKYYAGHSVGDGHDYHAVCSAEGCTEVAKHEHQPTTSNSSSMVPSLCNVAGCNTAGVHQHGGKYYSGHSAGDGHDYHAVCSAAGCSTAGVHQHNGEHYFGHFVNDGHDYHAVCSVEGCTEITKHAHQFTTSSRENGHHNSSHGHGGHH